MKGIRKKGSSIKACIIIFIIIAIIGIVIKTTDIFSEAKIQMERKGEPFKDNIINNEYFGINANGEEASQTTRGINEAIQYAARNNINNIKLEKGRYLIDGKETNGKVNEADTKKGIILESNITLDLNGSEIIQEKNNAKNYANISITDVQNVAIKNGKIIGEAEEHDYTIYNSTYEWGFGIDIRGSHSVLIENVEITQCTGDGIIVTDYLSRQNYAQDVQIRNTHIYNCRRQGISVISCENLQILNNEIYNIKGTNPQSGIDLESWDSEQTIDNVIIKNNKIYNTKSGRSIIVMGISKKIYIEENEIYGAISCDNVKEQIKIQNNKVKDGTISLLVPNNDLEIGKIIQKAIVKDNSLDNSNLYVFNVEDALVENNTIVDRQLMVFNSNVCLYKNKLIKKEKEYIGLYSKLVENTYKDRYEMFLYENEYSDNITKKEQIEQNDKLKIYTDKNEVEEYKKKFEREE